MKKMITGLLIGMVLMGALLTGSLSLTPAKAHSEDSGLTDTVTDIVETYRKTITSVLLRSGDEIQDEETAKFYQKLLQEYGLDQPSEDTIAVEHSSLADILPDIKNISERAVTLPLQEAGKNIRDEDIAQFYYRLLKDAGINIDSN